MGPWESLCFTQCLLMCNRELNITLFSQVEQTLAVGVLLQIKQKHCPIMIKQDMNPLTSPLGAYLFFIFLDGSYLRGGAYARRAYMRRGAY